MNPNKALWEKGDFTRIASSMRESGEALVRAVGVKPGLKVLDLGCGDGTTAVPAAKLGDPSQPPQAGQHQPRLSGAALFLNNRSHCAFHLS